MINGIIEGGYTLSHITVGGKLMTNTNSIYDTSYIIYKHTNTISGKSKYLKSLKESPLGKTYEEIGFNFEPM